MVTLDDLRQDIANLKQAYDNAIGNSRINPRQIAIQKGLSDIDISLGVIRAGEFLALSKGIDPQESDTTGTFISALGKIFNDKKYHIGGVNLGELKWGVNSETGQLEAGDGAVVLTENGLSIFSDAIEIARLGNITDFLPDITSHGDDVVYGFIIGREETYMTYDSFRGLRIFGALQTNRETLTSDRIYYVSPSGSDSDSSDGSSTNPFLTIQHAINYISSNLDTRQYNITISVADGEYSYSTIALKNISGSGSVTITGNTTTPASVYIKNTGNGFEANHLSTIYTIQGMKISAEYYHVKSEFGSTIRVSNLIFYTALSGLTYGHLHAIWGGIIEIIGPYTISGNAYYHFRSLERGYIYYDGLPTPLLPITISAGLTFSGCFAMAAIQSSLYVPYLDFGGVEVTGKKYECNILSFIGTNTAGINYFPGSSAGTVADYGVYD